ncbi:UNVERIFIED_CONTAM: hypothetical protein GTU68_060681 [Idotea baltica]|nr:hypothetical protein [Idotea baltica]
MVRTYKPKKKMFNEATIEVAINEVEDGASIRSTAARYGMSHGLLHNRIQERKGKKMRRMKQGRKTALLQQLELTLVDMLKRMEAMGLGPTISEFQEILADYISNNEIPTRFVNNKPGKDWVFKFLQRHKLTLKKGGMMQLARKSVTSDPFVIYDFYEKLQNEIERLGIQDRPNCIYNCDETGFPTDPSKSKTIGSIGQKTVRLTHGSNRENITVLATCCADGTALDPLIVFKGKKLQTTWAGEEALPETKYAVTDSGWMTRDVFEDYFKQLAESTKPIRPLLLILDGHLSHSSLSTIELAIKENISIIKLPAHCTDLLQPLDVACFGPLKMYYDKELSAYVQATGGREPLRKASFVNMLCKVWKKGLSSENIVSGFKATGIFPINPAKYSTSRLDTVKLQTYNAWIADGKKKDEQGNPILPATMAQLQANVEEQRATGHQRTNSERVEAPLPDLSPIPSTSGVQTSRTILTVSPSVTSTNVHASTPKQPTLLSEATMEGIDRRIQRRGRNESTQRLWKKCPFER